MRKQRNEEQTLKESKEVFRKIAENDIILKLGIHEAKKTLSQLDRYQVTAIILPITEIIYEYNEHIKKIKTETESFHQIDDNPLTIKIQKNNYIQNQSYEQLKINLDKLTKKELDKVTLKQYILIREIHEYLLQVNAEFNQEIEEFTNSILDEIMKDEKINIDYNTEEKNKK